MRFWPALADFVTAWFVPWRSGLCVAALVVVALWVWLRAGSRLSLPAIVRALLGALTIVGVSLVFVLVIGFFEAYATRPIEVGFLVALVTACIYGAVFVGPGVIDDAAGWVSRASTKGESQ